MMLRNTWGPRVAWAVAAFISVSCSCMSLPQDPVVPNAGPLAEGAGQRSDCTRGWPVLERTTPERSVTSSDAPLRALTPIGGRAEPLKDWASLEKELLTELRGGNLKDVSKTKTFQRLSDEKNWLLWSSMCEQVKRPALQAVAVLLFSEQGPSAGQWAARRVLHYTARPHHPFFAVVSMFKLAKATVDSAHPAPSLFTMGPTSVTTAAALVGSTPKAKLAALVEHAAKARHPIDAVMFALAVGRLGMDHANGALLAKMREVPGIPRATYLLDSGPLRPKDRPLVIRTIVTPGLDMDLFTLLLDRYQGKSFSAKDLMAAAKAEGLRISDEKLKAIKLREE